MFKKIILLASGIIISPILHSYEGSPLNEKNLPHYAEHYINTLFNTHCNQPRDVREFITHIKNNTVNSAQATCEEFYWFFPTGTFQRECVENAIRTTALNVITEEVHTITYGLTHDESTLTYIKETINNEILRIFSESGNLSGALRGYLGENLKQKVWQLKNKFDNEKRLTQINYYPSNEYCTCLEAFDNEVRQVFLKPCGHDICADCATNWFFEQNKNSCPHCRADVSKSELRKALRGQ